jgi:predicted nuclease of predicted toxin-antitoxin system
VPSKKRSAAKPRDRSVFFIDRSLGVEPLRSALVEAGLTVEIHDDHFQRDEEDQLWLAVVGQRRWVVLTKDQKLRYRPLEIAALRASAARVFILVAGNLRGGDIASVFVTALPRMFRILDRHDGPFVARVANGGSVVVGA